MEDFNHKEYRKSAADDLKDLRVKKLGDKARSLLKITHELERYKKAKYIHQEENKAKSQEDDQQEKSELLNVLVEKTIEMIEKEKGLDFLVGIIGNLDGKLDSQGRANGSKDFYFNKKLKKLQEFGWKQEHTYRTLDLGPNFFSRSQDKEQIFKPYWKTFKVKSTFGEKIVTAVRIPFRAMNLNNTFCTDTRSGVHLTLALQYSDKLDNIDFLDEKIRKFLEYPNKPEANKFFSKLLQRCAKKYMPEYWNFFREQKDFYKNKIRSKD